MPAPLIQPEDKQPDEKLEIRMRPELASDLRAYGEFADGSSPSHVVAAALKRLFREDKGFKAFRDANPKAGFTKVHKIRKEAATSVEGPA